MANIILEADFDAQFDTKQAKVDAYKDWVQFELSDFDAGKNLGSFECDVILMRRYRGRARFFMRNDHAETMRLKLCLNNIEPNEWWFTSHKDTKFAIIRADYSGTYQKGQDIPKKKMNVPEYNRPFRLVYDGTVGRKVVYIRKKLNYGYGKRRTTVYYEVESGQNHTIQGISNRKWIYQKWTDDLGEE